MMQICSRTVQKSDRIEHLHILTNMRKTNSSVFFLSSLNDLHRIII